jgi:hypothetical protein
VVRFNPFFHGQLTRLSNLDHCSVEAGDPDPRGWIVFLSDGRRLGTVIDLLVDENVNNVRSLVVDVDGGALPGVSASGQTALVRIEDVDLDGGSQRVTARAIACDDIHRAQDSDEMSQQTTEEDHAPASTV